MVLTHPFPQGTLPFMSYELLRYRRVRHGPWHDLESFLYVLIFVGATCAGPYGTRRKEFELSNTPLAPWLVGNGEYKEEVMKVLEADFWLMHVSSLCFDEVQSAI